MRAEDALIRLNALANATRYRMVEVLLDAAPARRMTPTELASDLALPRNLISSHLAVLDAAGLVNRERTGRNIRYSVEKTELKGLSAHLGRIADGPAT